MNAPASRRAFLGIDRPLIGVVHLQPLPGAPKWAGDMAAVLARASADARALAEGGVDALLVENYGDQPFWKDHVPAETVAALAVAARAVRDACPELPLGVNCLRNDAHAALAVAAAAGAAFVRVNVLTGAVLTDQGVTQGRAAEVLRARQSIAPRVLIAADVLVKHATPLVPTTVAEAARDAAGRGAADAIIVTGTHTGRATALDDVRAAREAAPGVPVLVGSGATAETIADILRVADGAIVGTAFERDGETGAPVELPRVRRLVAAAREVRSGDAR